MELFKSIALCFSGGGYRAACFSLGTLSLLEKVGLLENVKAISTVSGGTITGVKYAQSQIEGKEFQTFFDEYYAWLAKDELTSNALSHLRWPLIWNQPENKHKRKNPINAFAIEYNKLTNNATLGEVQDAISEGKTHLERVIFNATDFDSTHQFRFQNIKGNQKRFGNGKAHSKYKGVINDIKLGDVIAASTAFPGGFEPIGFPYDFTPKHNDLEEIGLMDGGIVDNQGASVFVSEAQNQCEGKPELHDLYFLCDVSSPYPGEGFKFASDSWFSKYVSYVSSAFTLLFMLIVTVFFGVQKMMVWYTISVVVLAFLVFIHFLFFSLSKLMQNETGVDQRLYLPPRRVGFYILNRAKSLVRMASVVFLKNDRRQHANAIYSTFPNKIITSTVYELRCKDASGNQTTRPENERGWEGIKKYTGGISEAIIKNSNKSASFGTTLWFTKKDKANGMLNSVIACGEYTACYNLLSYLIIQYGDRATEMLIFKKLLSLWKKFQENPHFLVEERQEKLKTMKG
ncbi:patatin-like phospholipase family protein [Tenacibaculum sp. XPcli2-G]|uniref:patatin-like phospholipase family protein n=1 Tax=Tenacibaculum sp. XPcli2-G TaxID=2954503 RepID=UPI00209774E8|nr:patatin-like phospholipase family protein [Tenacibaculum sp. XPcli2-G]MCO7184561.1 patatin-like phospholipase family protein [Tenacibaculum sp. XPcli2-G]